MYDVVTIGSATRDVLLKSDTFAVVSNKKRGLEESLVFPLGSKIPVKSIFFGTGGAGTNTAVTFARQGFRVASIVNVGNDIGGKAVYAELRKEHVDTRFLTSDHQKTTAYSVILEPQSGERVILNYRGANDNMRGAIVPFSKIRTHWLYLTSLSGDTSIVKGAVALKKKYATRIAWNPGGHDLSLGLAKLRPYLRFIDVFLVNQEEASDLLNISYRHTEQVFKKFDEVIEGIAVMTMGPKGVLVSDGKTMWQAGIFREKRVADRTGAGDSFGSGFVAGIMRKMSGNQKEFTNHAISYALRLGSANATSKVECIGAKKGLLTKRQFERQLRWRRLPLSIKKLS